ncbi:alpha/beta fold hydrolase [Lysobacter brunescens]|uniref:Alpha/beta fold hydrolase n=1 Tax=Lysobacter brunescens TaxID=262323 RepID=A0ABW2YES9_9GAMM
MSGFVPWDSQSLDDWTRRHARGATIELAGYRTHYIEKGEGPPLILLHGFFYDTYLWAENIDALARHFKVYALDLWGCGYSTRDPMDYGYALYAEQLRLFMDAMGLAHASIAGQSMGAGTAIKFCVEHRDRVDRLVLVDAAGMPNPLPAMAKFFNLPGLGEFLLTRKTDLFRRMALKDLFIHDASRITDDYYANVVRAHKIAGSVTAGFGIQRADFFDKLSDEVRALGSLDVPVMLVWGRQDKAIPLHCAQQMHALLPGSRLEILDRAGHVANFEQADAFNRLAIDFLRESASARTQVAGPPTERGTPMPVA